MGKRGELLRKKEFVYALVTICSIAVFLMFAFANTNIADSLGLERMNGSAADLGLESIDGSAADLGLERIDGSPERSTQKEENRFFYTYPRALDLDAGILHNYISRHLEIAKIIGVTVGSEILIEFDRELTSNEKNALDGLMANLLTYGIPTFAYRIPRALAYEVKELLRRDALYTFFDGDFVWLHFEEPLSLEEKIKLEVIEKKETKGEMPPSDRPASEDYDG